MTTQLTSFDQVHALQAKLRALPAARAKIARRVAPMLSELAQAAFDAHQTPYGGAWEPGIDLYESGRLRSQATRYVAEGTRVRASVGAVRYGRYQLKQGFLPAKGRMPTSWGDRIDKIAREELEKAVQL